jgi:hypothetical protein
MATQFSGRQQTLQDTKITYIFNDMPQFAVAILPKKTDRGSSIIKLSGFLADNEIKVMV